MSLLFCQYLLLEFKFAIIFLSMKIIIKTNFKQPAGAKQSIWQLKTYLL